jgi:hypothetical protein
MISIGDCSDNERVKSLFILIILSVKVLTLYSNVCSCIQIYKKMIDFFVIQAIIKYVVLIRPVSSVGEHFLDREGVGGSSPSQVIKKKVQNLGRTGNLTMEWALQLEKYKKTAIQLTLDCGFFREIM